MANLQLAELEAYDRLLDGAVERSYRDIGARKWSTFKTIGIPGTFANSALTLPASATNF